MNGTGSAESFTLYYDADGTLIRIDTGRESALGPVTGYFRTVDRRGALVRTGFPIVDRSRASWLVEIDHVRGKARLRGRDDIAVEVLDGGVGVRVTFPCGAWSLYDADGRLMCEGR